MVFSSILKGLTGLRWEEQESSSDNSGGHRLALVIALVGLLAPNNSAVLCIVHSLMIMGVAQIKLLQGRSNIRTN